MHLPWCAPVRVVQVMRVVAEQHDVLAAEVASLRAEHKEAQAREVRL